MKDILLAADEAYLIRLLRNALEAAGYRVRQAANGDQAYAEIRRQKPDFLITAALQLATGEDLCQKLTEDMPSRDFGILVLSSSADGEPPRSTEDAAGIRFMEKPVSVRQLLATLAGHFAVSQQRGAAWTATR